MKTDPSARGQEIEQPGGTAPSSGGDGMSVLAIANAILRRGRLVFWVTMSGGVVGVLMTLLFGDFKAESSFRPAQSSALSGLASIAAQLGADVGGLAASQTEPLEFWSQLLQSRDLLKAVAQTEFTFAANRAQTDTLRGTPIELYDISERTPEKTLLAATKRLDDDITVKTDLTSGVVTLVVKAPWRGLAVKLNRELLRRVNDFNLHTHQSEAAAEAAFTGARRDSAKAELLVAEDSLRQFLENNKTYQSSPRLTFEEARLQRRVDLRQQVYTGLAQAYEQARIEEVRNTPVITVMETPEGSAERNLGVPASGVLGAFLGAVVALTWVLIGEFVHHEHETNPAELQEFIEVSQQLVPVWLRKRARAWAREPTSGRKPSA